MYLIEANVQQMAEIVIAVENPTTFKQFAGSEKTDRSTNTPVTAAVEGVESSSDSDESVLKVEHVGTVQHNRKGHYFVPLAFLNDNVDFNISCQLDTGATCNVITHRDVCCIQQTGKPILQASKAKLKFYDGSVAHVLV